MKYTKHETIETQHVTVDLEPDDYIIVKIGGSKLFLLSYNSLSRTIQMRLSSAGDMLEKPPFLEVTQEQMEDLEYDKTKGEYISINFPSALYSEIKKRLTGLPLIV